jgi:hypothetical protein
MSYTSRTDEAIKQYVTSGIFPLAILALNLERECNQLRAALEEVDIAFPDILYFEDRDGASLAWLAKQIEEALKKEKA